MKNPQANPVEKLSREDFTSTEVASSQKKKSNFQLLLLKELNTVSVVCF